MMKTCQKTVFVLDHGPWFAGTDAEQYPMEKGKSSSEFALKKSVWTSCVEAALEYLRIITDLFGESHLLRFVVSDCIGRFLAGPQASWAPKFQALENVYEQFAQIGAPDPDSDPDMCNVVSGIMMAVEALSQATDTQKAALKRGNSIKNPGRIVLITHIKKEEEIMTIERELLDQIAARNNLVRTLDENFSSLDHVEFCLINVETSGDLSILNRERKQVSKELCTEFRSTMSGQSLFATMQSLTLNHFNLISTTVTGIPMKEETTTSGGSTNYDVELFHALQGHTEMKRIGLLEALLAPPKNGRSSLNLKWSSPNVKAGLNPDQFLCASAIRVTPAQVNSRPSACLTSFILSGRTVLLEVPKKAGVVNVQNNALGGKPVSHLLSAHGGQICLHALTLGSNPLEEPPSISEGSGGLVRDYRIQWFGTLMKECSLAPGTEEEDPPNKKSRTQIARLTQKWPMTIGSSFLSGLCSQPSSSIYNQLNPLMTVIKKTQLSETEAMTCKKGILSLLTMEKNNEPLPLPSANCTRLKGLKKDEYYRPMWEELEDYLRNYSHMSANHLDVLNCLLQCLLKPTEIEVSKEELNRSFEETNPILAATKSMSSVMSTISNDSLKSGSVKLEPRAPKTCKEFKKGGKPVSFLSMFIRKYEEKHWSRWKDFDGRVSGGNKVALYQEFAKAMEDKSEPLKECLP